MVGWLVVFNVPSTLRSFRDGAPIYCPLRRTCSAAVTQWTAMRRLGVQTPVRTVYLSSFTSVTSRCVRRSVMSAMDFHRSVVSACGHNGTTGTSRYVRRSVMSSDNLRDSLYLEYTPSKTYFNPWFVKIKYGLDVYMTNF